MQNQTKRISGWAALLVTLVCCSYAEGPDLRFANRACVAGHGEFIVENYQNGVSDETIRTAVQNETGESPTDDVIAGLRKILGIMRPEETPSNVIEYVVFAFDAAHQYKKMVPLTETELAVAKQNNDELRAMVSERISAQTYCRDESQLAVLLGGVAENGRTNYFATINSPEEMYIPPFCSFGLVGYYMTEKMLQDKAHMVIVTNSQDEITIVYTADNGNSPGIERQGRIEMVLDAVHMVVKTYRWYRDGQIWHEHKYEDYVLLRDGEYFPRHSEWMEYVPASGIPLPVKREVFWFLGDGIHLKPDDDALFKPEFPRRTKVVDYRFNPPHDYIAQ